MIPPAADIIMFKRDLTMGNLMSEDSEEYLVLGDEEPESPSDVAEQPSKAPSFPKLGPLRLPRRSRSTSGATSNQPADEPLPEATREIPDIGLSLDGVHQFDWGIQGMDCPDCAMKATRAVNRLPGVESCKISVADGTVEISQDMSRGSVSRASSVLGSLGHAPDIDWLYVVGTDPERLASEQGISTKLLREWILDTPGVLDVRLNKGMVEVQSLWLRNAELREASEKKLAGILGPGFRMAPYRGARFRQDQKQLLSAVLTIPLIIVVAAIEAADSIPPIVASLVALVGITFTGLPMFQAALASLQNRIVGFQVLTTLAVIGAVGLGEWVEALMVVALVAFASHLENRALIRARESMQGGLDRLPRTARIHVPETPAQSGERALKVIQPGTTLAPAHGPADDLVPVEALEIGELVEVRSGETVPVDGTIVEGAGAIDRAPLTGEPIPIPVKEGDSVEAGLVLVRGPLVIRSEASGDGTRLSSLIDLVRHYKDQPTRTQSVIERFTMYWTRRNILIGP